MMKFMSATHKFLKQQSCLSGKPPDLLLVILMVWNWHIHNKHKQKRPGHSVNDVTDSKIPSTELHSPSKDACDQWRGMP
jgi:hypothetical protein